MLPVGKHVTSGCSSREVTAGTSNSQEEPLVDFTNTTWPPCVAPFLPAVLRSGFLGCFSSSGSLAKTKHENKNKFRGGEFDRGTFCIHVRTYHDDIPLHNQCTLIKSKFSSLVFCVCQWHLQKRGGIRKSQRGRPRDLVLPWLAGRVCFLGTFQRGSQLILQRTLAATSS
jgi:hypothetical protein